MAVITLQNVKKTYNPDTIPVEAVKGVDLAIEAAEFTAIVGPSGSGKSTLLNIIGGLDQPSEGRVQIGDTFIHDLAENDLIDFRLKNIGFVFQAYNLIPVLTAKENVEFILLLQKRPEAERNQRVKELMNDIGLAEKMDVRPSQLSGGQQQRVAVARALASKPKFILADEPTANLDSQTAENLLDIMWQLNQKEKITFLFSTHDERVVRRAKRVLTLRDGLISSDVQQD